MAFGEFTLVRSDFLAIDPPSRKRGMGADTLRIFGDAIFKHATEDTAKPPDYIFRDISRSGEHHIL